MGRLNDSIRMELLKACYFPDAVHICLNVSIGPKVGISVTIHNRVTDLLATFTAQVSLLPQFLFFLLLGIFKFILFDILRLVF